MSRPPDLCPKLSRLAGFFRSYTRYLRILTFPTLVREIRVINSTIVTITRVQLLQRIFRARRS